MLDTLTEQLQSMATSLVASLPAMVIAIVVLIVTAIVAKFSSQIVNLITGKTELRQSLRDLAVTITRLGVWIVGTMIAAMVLLPGVTPGSLIAGLGIGAVAIGFAFQDIFENFLAGVLIMLRKKMRIGDVIECEGISGKVEHVSLRETHVRKLSGELTVVPNSVLFKNPVEILTDQEQRRHNVVIGVSYDTDLDRAASVIREAVMSVDDVDKERKLDVFAQEFNSSSVDFMVRWWAGASPRDGWVSTDSVIRAIKRDLDEAGIEIPFPYITHTFKEPVPLSDKAKD